MLTLIASNILPQGQIIPFMIMMADEIAYSYRDGRQMLPTMNPGVFTAEQVPPVHGR